MEFKLFSKYKINTLHAIVINYIVACCCGLIFQKSELNLLEIPKNNWFPFALALGALFITVFNLMAVTTQRSGLSVVSVATKMSVVIPVIFGLVYYKEHLTPYTTIGILLSLAAVYLASFKKKEANLKNNQNLILAILVFLGSGIIDTSIKYLEEEYVAPNDIPVFSATIFASAAILGIVFLSIQALRAKFWLKTKTVLGGLVLGITNYFSFYFLVKALRSGIFESAGIFTINNVGIVMISTLAGMLLFKEKLVPKNWIGIGLAILAILLFTMEKW